jgi:phosphoribosylformylglycinamidine cyclo-ligase
VASERQTYAGAGVSIEKGNAVVERLRAAAESTGARGFGAFAGLHPLDDTRLLAASTDSVGTKLILARQRGALRSCGADLGAHCVNDVITCGAEPLLFLDYVAANRIDPEQVAELVEGLAEVCRVAGCALVGGETAELPGIYREDELDFAGTCVGIVERDRVVDGSRIEEGDAIVGLASAGLHANGFTLVRRILEHDDYTGDDLLAPTRLYLDDVRALREGADVRGLAHVTGGGIAGNLDRLLPDGLRAEIDWGSWTRPPVFDWLARHVEEEELRRVFNLGIGYVAVVPDPDDALVIGTVRACGSEPQAASSA